MPTPWTEYMREMGLGDPGGESPLAPPLDPDVTPLGPYAGPTSSVEPGLGMAPYTPAYSPAYTTPLSMPGDVAGNENPKGNAQVSAAQQSQRGKHASQTGSVAEYIRNAALQRGIDPDVALSIAQHEGGLDDDDVAREGSFKTGKSYWAFQLHYGGAGTPYAHYGDTAGMGNDFTARTGYQPGDPNAWQAAVDFALDHARRYGWKAWYGRKPAGIGEWDGIPR